MIPKCTHPARPNDPLTLHIDGSGTKRWRNMNGDLVLVSGDGAAVREEREPKEGTRQMAEKTEVLSLRLSDCSVVIYGCEDGTFQVRVCDRNVVFGGYQTLQAAIDATRRSHIGYFADMHLSLSESEGDVVVEVCT